MLQNWEALDINLFTSPLTGTARLSLEQGRLLYRWRGADVDSLRGHLVVVASRGKRCLAHLDKPQGPTVAHSFTLPFLHIQDNIREVDHGILYRLVQDMSVKRRN